jgi:hypothetical protein
MTDWVCGVCNNEPCTCESIVEAAAPRWKRAGPNGEIEITIKGTKYKIEKALDHNERHKGEFKIMVWDARRREWVWDNTVRGKAYAKELVMDKLDENAGLWANIHAKRRRGERMRKKGEKGAPTPDAIRKAQEDMGGTTTASVVGAGDNPTGTVVIDKRRRKDKMPRVLKRFRTYVDSDA